MANQKKSDTIHFDTNEVRQAQASASAPRRKKKKKKKNRLLSALVYILCVVLISALLAGVGWLLANDLWSLNKNPVNATIVVDEDDSVSDVAQKLKDAGLINYKWFFCLAGRFLHADEIIEPGEYKDITSDMDYRALIHALHHYQSFETVSVTIPEGKTVSEIFDILVENNVCTRDKLVDAASNHVFENHPYLPAVDPEKTDNYIRLEGFLFPDTYEFYVNGDPVQVLDTMPLNGLQGFADADQDPQNVRNGQRLIGQPVRKRGMKIFQQADGFAAVGFNDFVIAKLHRPLKAPEPVHDLHFVQGQPILFFVFAAQDHFAGVVLLAADPEYLADGAPVQVADFPQALEARRDRPPGHTFFTERVHGGFAGVVIVPLCALLKPHCRCLLCDLRALSAASPPAAF